MAEQTDTEPIFWLTKLDEISKGQKVKLDCPEQTVYSIIRTHFKDSKKTFSIRTFPKNLGKYVIRTK